MNAITLTIPLDEELAKIYEHLTDEDREKIQVLVRMWLRETAGQADTLTHLMNLIGERAEKRGLTPEILETLLSDDA